MTDRNPRTRQMSNSIRAASLQARRLVDQVSARRRGEPVQSPSPTFGDTYPWLIDQGTTVLPAEVRAPFSELLDELGVVTCADLARVHVQDFLDLRGAGPGVLGKLRHSLAQPPVPEPSDRVDDLASGASEAPSEPAGNRPAPDQPSARTDIGQVPTGKTPSTLGDRFPWLHELSDSPIDYERFSFAKTALRRRFRCQTWGDLASLDESVLASATGVGPRTIERLHTELSQGATDSSRGSDSAGDGESSVLFGARHPWMLTVSDEPVSLEIFDARSKTALSRARVHTWGDLAALSNHALAEIPAVGELTIQRINAAISGYAPPAEAPHRSAGDAADDGRPHEAYRLSAAADWSMAVLGQVSLGELLEVARAKEVRLPPEVSMELDTFLSQPVGGRREPVALLDDLLDHALDRDLLVARECSRDRPTLDALGQERGITRERIRQKVAKDTKAIRSYLASDSYRPLRWTVDQLRDDLGLMVPADSAVVESWHDRLGEVHFEILRWLAGYIHREGWLQRGKRAVADLVEAVEAMVGDEWLLSRETLSIDCDVEVGGGPETLARFLVESGAWREIGDGWMVRWDGPLQTKAERVLRLTCRPMTPAELVEAIGTGTEGSLRNQRGDLLVRVDKSFRLALPEWGFEEYSGIADEIVQRVERGGGVASRAAIVEEFTSQFGVSENSIDLNLRLPLFVVSGDEVRLGDPTRFDALPPHSVPAAVKTAEGWGERFEISPDSMRGYSFNLNPHIAWANGIRPQDNLVVPIAGADGTASVIWRVTNVTGRIDVGHLSNYLKDRGLAPGDRIVICVTRDRVFVYAGREEIDRTRRAAERQTVLPEATRRRLKALGDS